VGGAPRYENTDIVTSTASRVGVCVVSAGTVQLRVQVLTQGFGAQVWSIGEHMDG
jgi:hypothetical protein